MRRIFAIVAAITASSASGQTASGLLEVGDYPSKAVEEGRGGKTTVEMNIDVKGRVTGCRVLVSSGHADLDLATCKVLTKRARFKPSTDETGKSIEGTYKTTVTWATQ